MQNKLKMGNKLIIALTEIKKWAFCVFVQLDPCKECRLFLIWKKKFVKRLASQLEATFTISVLGYLYIKNLLYQTVSSNFPIKFSKSAGANHFGRCMPIDNRFDVILLAASFPGNNTASVLQNCRTGLPSSSVDWIVLNLNNSSHHTRPHSITKFGMNWHFASLFS